jgi:hypothetical protein
MHNNKLLDVTLDPISKTISSTIRTVVVASFVRIAPSFAVRTLMNATSTPVPYLLAPIPQLSILRIVNPHFEYSVPAIGSFARNCTLPLAYLS